MESLKEIYKLKVKRHKDYPNLVLLKYNMIHSNFTEKIVCEARGIILDENDDWKIISFPYTKFFNFGEPNAKSIIEILDYDSIKFYDKLDGSLMTLYYYDHKWHVSSSGMPDASGNCGDTIFSVLFWDVWNELKYVLPDENDLNKCFIFELLTPKNQLVVPQKYNRIILHGTRNLNTLKEEDPEIYSNKYKWEKVRNFSFSSVEDAINIAKTLDPKIGEGFIVCDKNFNRIKIKGDEYVKLSYMSDENMNPDLIILKIIQQGEGDEFIAQFPKFKDIYDKINTKYLTLLAEIEQQKNKGEKYTDIKTYALTIKDLWYKSCLFDIKNKKIDSVKSWLSKFNSKKLLQYLLDTKGNE